MEPVTAQMTDLTVVWMCIAIMVCMIGFVAVITRERPVNTKPQRRSFEDAYLDKLSNTDF
jgi:Na+/melibiose symporter-like transporter